MKRLLVFLLVLALGLITAPAVQAHCPLCVAGAGVGLSLSRYLGVDDSITGIWLATFLGAISFWSFAAIRQRIQKPNLTWLKPALYLLIFSLTIWSFYQFNLVIRMEKIYGLDKLTFGMIVGGVAFYLVEVLNDWLIKIRGKSFFPYQRLISSLGVALILSLIDDILIGYYI